MSNNVLISFIVPVYNTPVKFLEECLDSLKKHENENLEFIIVDDGSSYDFSLVFSKYENDKRFKFYKKENSGVSETRNYGIQKANGEFICFVDSDDLTDVSYFIKNVSNFENYDLLCFNSSMINSSSKLKRMFILNTSHILGEGVVWAKIFKLSFIKDNKLEFNSNLKYAEDSIFITNLLSFKPKVQCFDKISIYKYRISNSHTTTRYNKDAFIDFNNTYMELFDKVNIDDLALVAFSHFYRYNLKISYYHPSCKIKNKKEKIYDFLNNDKYLYKVLFGRLDNLPLSKYCKIQRYLLKKKKYGLMAKLDVLVCRIFRKC